MGIRSPFRSCGKIVKVLSQLSRLLAMFLPLFMASSSQFKRTELSMSSIWERFGSFLHRMGLTRQIRPEASCCAI